MTATQHERQAGRIVTGEHGKTIRNAVDQFDVVADIAAGFFHTDDIRNLGQTQNSVVAHADDGTAGNIIDNHRNRSGFGDGFEMLVNAFLRRFVVVGNNR